MSAFKGYFRNPDTQHTYKPANYSVPDLYSDEPVRANTAVRARAAGIAGQKWAEALADIWTKAFSLTGELVAVAGCESGVSAAICCHNIRVT